MKKENFRNVMMMGAVALTLSVSAFAADATLDLIPATELKNAVEAELGINLSDSTFEEGDALAVDSCADFENCVPPAPGIGMDPAPAPGFGGSPAAGPEFGRQPAPGPGFGGRPAPGPMPAPGRPLPGRPGYPVQPAPGYPPRPGHPGYPVPGPIYPRPPMPAPGTRVYFECFARDSYGRTFASRAYNPEFAQRNAMRSCFVSSYGCYEQGCRRVW